MQALQFPRGNYYLLICKAGQVALKVQQIDPSKYEKSRIISDKPNPQDLHQLFMIQKIGIQDDSYQIINCPSTLVFQETGNQIRLKYGTKSKSQLLYIQQAPMSNQIKNKYYWIKSDKTGKQAVFFQGILRYGNFDPNNQNQLFRFQEVKTNSAAIGSALIINNLSGKCLDVPQATRKKGERIIQYQKNKRWNQRWRFMKKGKGVMIQSIFNNLVLDIAQEKKKSGAEVIQWDETGNSNQQWFPEPAGNGLFKFRSCHEPSLFLAIKGADVNNKGKLQVCSDENPSMYWRIQGAMP